jgi:hypothetical protein
MHTKYWAQNQSQQGSSPSKDLLKEDKEETTVKEHSSRFFIVLLTTFYSRGGEAFTKYCTQKQPQQGPRSQDSRFLGSRRKTMKGHI